ncbi:uncharacterized protein FFMR_09478 [Fusarium fujikuroi]|uniref:Uncharacterized protein n=1 Tax=Fusarium fujikuroi TaxID=5127 RepID=A0A9Q9RDY5_FUSFU|nr:uncharacterized protein FFM5_03494 [Fusarium fujikuroi]SCO49011.1 uncharacterized protein FFMR_09478 [Fusarium fujikuroi]VTT59561.1 unnamed protein product [Fusarium fujikuroi]VTT75899.1 unnamed protein product [Fusarium fujikuroi]VZI18940.1 unnamed protein product [Fusarium fujikuroi]
MQNLALLGGEVLSVPARGLGLIAYYMNNRGGYIERYVIRSICQLFASLGGHSNKEDFEDGKRIMHYGHTYQVVLMA